MSVGAWVVRLARADELDGLQALEMRAGVQFIEVGLAHVAEAPPMSIEALARARATGRLLVIAGDDAPLGFAVTDVIDGHTHLDELSVEPASQGQGLGARLIEEVCARARADGHAEVSLLTFRDVPWNAPYYRRRGFRVIPEAAWGPGLRARVDAEVARGLHTAPRVAMARSLA